LAGPAKKAEESEDLTQIVSGAESHEEEEGDDGHASFTESDGEDDDGDADATRFQSLLAKARQRGARKSLDTSVQCIVAGGQGGVASPATPSTPEAASTPGIQATLALGAGQANLIQRLMDEVTNMKAEQANFRQQASIGDALNKTSNHMAELINSSKRVREEKKEMPEDPVLATWSPKGENAVDDNHKDFAWEIRRSYKQPNADPRVYWAKAKYRMKVEPNLRESLFLHHLMPLGLSSKALGWGHDLLANTAIKYYTHNQAVSGRKRKSNFCVEEDADNMESRIVSVGQEWAEASSLHEIAEAVHNWAAVRFQCAPWDWSGLLLLRVLHETSYFSTASDGEGSQRALAEKFIDEFLSKNRRNLMQARPPMDYKRAILLAEDVTRSYNGKQDRLWTKTDLYSAYRQAHAGKAEVGRLEAEVKRLKTENNFLKNSPKGINPRGGDHLNKSPPRRARKSGMGGGDTFMEERKEASTGLGVINNC
jgi:hypothetical protein